MSNFDGITVYEIRAEYMEGPTEIRTAGSLLRARQILKECYKKGAVSVTCKAIDPDEEDWRQKR